MSRQGDSEERSREAASTASVAQSDTPPDQSAATAPSAGSVDVSMLRRGWPSLMDHLGSTRQMILKAALESATVASFDGRTLELAFPPQRNFTVSKVEAKVGDLQAALGDLFGIRPAIVCVVREARDAGGPAVIEIVDEEEPPTEEEALRRVQEIFGVQVPAEAGEPAE